MRPKGKEYVLDFSSNSHSPTVLVVKPCEISSECHSKLKAVDDWRHGRRKPRTRQTVFSHLFVRCYFLSHVTLTALASGYFFAGFSIVSCACTAMRINRVQCTVTKCYKFPRLLARFNHLDLVSNQNQAGDAAL